MTQIYVPISQRRNHGSGRISVRLHLDLEAYEIIRELAPSKHSHGEFINRLVYEFHARQAERQRLQAQIAAALGAAQ